MATITTVDVSQPGTVSAAQVQRISPGISLVSGAIAGAVEATITYPFEFAKTRSQLGVTGSKGSAISSNPLTLISQSVRDNGVQSLYKGCSTLVLGTAFKAGVRFLTFDSIKDFLSDSKGRLSPANGILAGMMAGTVESFVAVTPTERIKTALIDDARSHKRFKGGLHAFRTIISDAGVPGLYRGLLSTTLKQAATSAVRMGSYNFLKDVVSRRAGNTQPTQGAIVTFGLGAVAGIITVYATQPFDTIKTRAQAAKGATTSEAIRRIVRERGIGGFWSGSSMRLGRLILSGGIVFTVYESVAGVLRRLPVQGEA
ncbi:mitochondrial carrier [Aspergillus pseudoustus]|uniref:Mitochondrial carrier n=1 Tax=Aspergillus pseudoustus TaxID=1810923 RepID=A0ABR4JX43_9EURO